MNVTLYNIIYGNLPVGYTLCEMLPWNEVLQFMPKMYGRKAVNLERDTTVAALDTNIAVATPPPPSPPPPATNQAVESSTSAQQD